MEECSGGNHPFGRGLVQEPGGEFVALLSSDMWPWKVQTGNEQELENSSSFLIDQMRMASWKWTRDCIFGLYDSDKKTE